MSIDWPISICSAGVGVLVGLTGMGGGSIMTALLILLFGIHPVAAVGTDLLFASITKSVGTAVHAGNRNVDWVVVRRLAIGSVPATAVSLFILSRAPIRDPAFEWYITAAIGVALVAAAACMLVRRRVTDFALRHSHAPDSTATAAMTVALGAALGCVVPMTSVGAGAIGLAILSLLYPNRAPVQLVGTDIAHAVPLTLCAGLGHWYIGTIDWGLLVSLLVGSIPGIAAGSHLAHRMPSRIMRPVIAGLLLAIGCGLLLR